MHRVGHQRSDSCPWFLGAGCPPAPGKPWQEDWGALCVVGGRGVPRLFSGRGPGLGVDHGGRAACGQGRGHEGEPDLVAVPSARTRVREGQAAGQRVSPLDCPAGGVPVRTPPAGGACLGRPRAAAWRPGRAPRHPAVVALGDDAPGERLAARAVRPGRTLPVWVSAPGWPLVPKRQHQARLPRRCRSRWPAAAEAQALAAGANGPVMTLARADGTGAGTARCRCGWITRHSRREYGGAWGSRAPAGRGSCRRAR